MPLTVFIVEVARNLMIDAENRSQERRANPHSVACLAEVDRAGVVIDFGGNFAKMLIAGKGMQDRRVTLHAIDKFATELVFRQIELRKMGFFLGVVVLFLNAGHVEPIEGFDHRRSSNFFLEGIDFDKLHAAVGEPLPQIVTQRERGIIRSDEHQSHAVVIGQQTRERPDRAPSADVAAEAIGFVGESLGKLRILAAQLVEAVRHRRVVRIGELETALQRINVEQRLGGMFVGTGSRIDDWHAAISRGFQIVHQVSARFGQPRELAPHDDQVEVTRKHAYGIEAGFALRF